MKAYAYTEERIAITKEELAMFEEVRGMLEAIEVCDYLPTISTLATDCLAYFSDLYEHFHFED